MTSYFPALVVTLLLLTECASFLLYIKGIQSYIPLRHDCSAYFSSKLKAVAQEGNSVGIDLGTTYSSIAVLNKAEKTPYILQFDGSKLLPSVVSYTTTTLF